MKKTADNAWIKNHNLKLILNLIKQKEEISRIQISKELDLSKSTVSLLVSYLIENGYIEEFKNGKSGGGRRPILLRLKSKNYLFAAIHVDDNGIIKAQTRDLRGDIIKQVTDAVTSSAELIKKLKNIIKKLNKSKKIRAAAIALPGIISQEGTILNAVNLGWKNVSITEKLNQYFDFPISAKNATGLAAFSESKLYKKENFNNLVYIHINSVVGGGFITNNKLYNGLLGSAVEIGHIVINPEGKECKCGQKGCLETIISQKAIFNELKKRVDKKILAKEKINEINIFNWLVKNEKEEIAKNMFNIIANNLSVALVSALNMLGPDAIVIESKLTESEIFWNELKKLVSINVLATTEKRYQLLKSRIKENKFLIGAAQYAEEYFYNDVQLYY